MAEWITPVTNRPDGSARMTYEDMNRITGDVAWLEEAILGSSTLSKTNWTRNDFITTTFWTEILTSINNMVSMVGAASATLTNEMSFGNINNVESAILSIYQNRGNTGVTDVMAYDTSIVTDGEAQINNSTLMDSTARSAWNAILS